MEPGNEDEVAEVLAFADKENLRVLVRGGGTQLGLGSPPTGGDILVSTVRLNAIIEHVPHDLVVTTQAGLPLATLQTALQQTNQWLALDPNLASEATIGGIIATNATGPRRLHYGGVRDQIIGIRVVLADGTIAKGGGKVVKNVAGYDIPKLFTGALGTLGVIVSATFRLYPLPPASCTVSITASDITALCDLAVQIIGSTLVPTMVDVLGNSTNTYTMGVRFEMGQTAIEAQTATLLTMVEEIPGDVMQVSQVLEGESEAHFWSELSHTQRDTTKPTLTLKASLLPTEVSHWLTHLEHECAQQQIQVTWHAHAGHGIVFAQFAGDNANISAVAQELRQEALAHQGSLVVTDAPSSIAQHIDVWGYVPAIEVMRHLKARFDPNNTLNPGRFVGGI